MQGPSEHKRKKSAILVNTERQKQILPTFSNKGHGMVELPFMKLEEYPSRQKVRIRLADGVEK